jgi:surfeit locus 1 family protein
VKKHWFYYLFAAMLCFTFLSLGRWQLSRAEWKQGRLDTVAAVLKERKPQSLAMLSGSGDTELAWVSGRGHFVKAPVLFLDNQRLGDKVGVNVYRVFQPDQGRPLLVNMGWLPVSGDRRMPTPEKISGNYQLDGLLVPPPSPGLAIGPAFVKTSDEYWLLTRMSLPALSAELKTPLASRVLRLNPDLPMGYARDLDILPNTLPPEKHRGYAVQWFGLGLATLVITIVLGIRNRKEKRNEREHKND